MIDAPLVYGILLALGREGNILNQLPVSLDMASVMPSDEASLRASHLPWRKEILILDDGKYSYGNVSVSKGYSFCLIYPKNHSLSSVAWSYDCTKLRHIINYKNRWNIIKPYYRESPSYLNINRWSIAEVFPLGDERKPVIHLNSVDTPAFCTPVVDASGTHPSSGGFQGFTGANSCINSGTRRLFRFVSGAPSFIGGTLSKIGGYTSSYESKKSDYRTPAGDSCLLEGEDGACVGGVRSASGLYEVVSGLAMLFFGFVASICFGLALPSGERIKREWLATGAASLVGSGLFLIATITGQVWPFRL